jgi:hypothetical protein
MLRGSLSRTVPEVASRPRRWSKGDHVDDQEATMETRSDPTSTAPVTWRWPAANLIGFPVGGYIADLAVNGVDSVGAALLVGVIVGAVVGAAQWFVLRQHVSWLWVPATTVGMAVGLVAGAAVVDYGITRGDLAVMGAVTGLAVGVMQALVLARHRIPRAVWWAVANPPAWALGWFVSSYVISQNVSERFPTFGASGAMVVGLLTWLLLTALFRGAAAVRAGAPQTPA